MYIIIAPHPDDELIGCFSLFRKKLIDSVIYLPSDNNRLKNASKFMNDMNVDFRMTNLSNIDKILTDNVIYLVPSLNDNHPLHKQVNIMFKSFNVPLGYYTTDMNTEYIHELSKEDLEIKKELLNKYYSDQKSLWEFDYKYFLFEGIVYDLLTVTT